MFNKRQEELERRLITVQLATNKGNLSVEEEEKLDLLLKKKLPICDLSEFKKVDN